MICVHNLDCSGANQVIFNIVQGSVHTGNIVVISPRMGPIVNQFIGSGASIRIGIVSQILSNIHDVFLIICNTIMTADIVVSMVENAYPVMWILHEWWTDEMIIENLKLRNIVGYGIKGMNNNN